MRAGIHQSLSKPDFFRTREMGCASGILLVWIMQGIEGHRSLLQKEAPRSDQHLKRCSERPPKHCYFNTDSRKGRYHLLRLNLSFSHSPGLLAVLPAKAPRRNLYWFNRGIVTPECWWRLGSQVGTDNTLSLAPKDPLKPLIISSPFSSAPEPPTLPTSHPRLLSSTAPVQSCSPFKSILTPNTSLFSQPACPKYFPPALTERVFTGQLQNNKFPFFETVVWGALWCGIWPTGDHLAGVAHYWVVNLTCWTEWLGSLWSPVRHFWVPSIKLCLMSKAKISSTCVQVLTSGMFIIPAVAHLLRHNQFSPAVAGTITCFTERCELH